MESVTFKIIFLSMDSSVRLSDSFLEILLVFLSVHESWVSHCRNMRNDEGVFSSVMCCLSNLELIDTDLIVSILENFVFERQLFVWQSSHAVSVDLGRDFDGDVDGDVLSRRVRA